MDSTTISTTISTSLSEFTFSISNIIGLIGILFFLPLVFSPIPTVYEGFKTNEIKNLSL